MTDPMAGPAPAISEIILYWQMCPQDSKPEHEVQPETESLMKLILDNPFVVSYSIFVPVEMFQMSSSPFKVFLKL
jgi:hypothetical protein